MDVAQTEPRWVSFSKIDSVFDQKNALFQLYRTHRENDGLPVKSESKRNFDEFLRRAYFAMNETVVQPNMEREFMNLPNTFPTPEETTIARAPNAVHVENEEDEDEDDEGPLLDPTNMMETTDMEDSFQSAKEFESQEENKKEEFKEETIKDETIKEEFEHVSQETLEESEDHLKTLKELEEEEEKKKNERPQRKAKQKASYPGAFSRFF